MTCILCAKRGKETHSETHVCVPCAARLQVDIADILRLAADAAAYVMPGSTTGGGARTVPSSRPPLNVDSLDPENTPVPIAGQPPEAWPSVLQVLEAWERMCREARDMAPYGPASLQRARQGEATLTGVVGFLGAQVAWMSTEPDFPVDDFAGEVRDCLRVLRRWDQDAQERGQVVPCPTLHDDDTECGYRLRYVSMDEQVTCRRCRVTRDVPQLLLAADADNALVDGEALAQRFAIDPSSIRKWARLGKVERQGQRYRYGDVRVMVEAMRGRRGHSA